jgi:hypothetical protein
MADENHLEQEAIHDIREGLALAKGWLELVFRHWDEIDDARRREMIAGALFGANRVAFVMDLLEGRDPAQVQSPQERMAEEFSRIEDELPKRFAGAAPVDASVAGRNRPGTARFRP